MITYLILGITYAFAAAIQPGPFQAFIISQTLTIGWKRTVPAAFAPVLSDVPVIILVLLILTNLPSELLKFLQIGGGLVLLYLAYGSYKSYINFEQLDKSETSRGNKTLFKAVLVNIMNPNPYIGWSLIMGPLFLTGYNKAPINGIALIAGFYVTIIICQIAIIIIFGLARNFGSRIARITLGIASTGLAVFGGYMLWHGFTEII